MSNTDVHVWRSIDTAPKDGTDILVFCGPAHDPMWGIAHWREPENKIYHIEKDKADKIFSPGWVLWWQNTLKRHRWPTHWMPLSAPEELDGATP